MQIKIVIFLLIVSVILFFFAIVSAGTQNAPVKGT